MVLFSRTVAVQNRTFSVVGPRVLNDFPQELRLFPGLRTNTFLGYLKACTVVEHLFVKECPGVKISMV